MNLNNLALFSGIGGLELGLERVGFETVGQVEIDPFARSILEQHWPEVPRHDDVRTAVEWWGSEPRPDVGLLSGGFPCQPVSIAGAKLGAEDPRWLWPGFKVVAAALLPPYILIENVPNLRNLGLDEILRDLAALGYDAWWSRIPAAALGAPHLRWRIIIIAVRKGFPFNGGGWPRERIVQWDGKRVWDVADPQRFGLEGTWQSAWGGQGPSGVRRRPAEPGNPQALADAGSAPGDAEGPAGQALCESGEVERPGRRSGLEPEAAGDRGSFDSAEPGLGGGPDGLSEGLDGDPWALTWWHDQWASGEWERDIPWTADGVSDRIDRLRVLGNAVVPAVGEYAGRILRAGAEYGITVA